MTSSTRFRLGIAIVCLLVAALSGYQFVLREAPVVSAPNNTANKTMLGNAQKAAMSGHQLIRILDDPRSPYQEREQAAQSLALMKFIPAIPVFIRNYRLVDTTGTYDEGSYCPCREEFHAFGKAAFPYVIEALLDEQFSLEFQFELYGMVREMERLPEAIAALEDALNEPRSDEGTLVLQRHIRFLKNQLANEQSQPQRAKRRRTATRG